MAGNTIKDKIAAGAKVVDVRTPAEFADGAYPGAVNIPLAGAPGPDERAGPKDKPIVLYCASGARSGQAMRFLKQNGFTDVVNAGASTTCRGDGRRGMPRGDRRRCATLPVLPLPHARREDAMTSEGPRHRSASWPRKRPRSPRCRCRRSSGASGAG